MKTLGRGSWLGILLLATAGAGSLHAAELPRYEADWTSLRHYTVPEWYRDAKFGIWPHWGIYSMPAYRGDHAAEWYGRWMYCVDDGSGAKRGPSFERRGLKTARHHRESYGDPRGVGYHDLIPLFRAERWDPDAWAQLTVDAGAKFFCMMAMHHDGFALWDSDVTRWNAMDMGPRRDLVGEIAWAVRRRGLKFGISNHFAWNWKFFEFYHHNGFADGREAWVDFYSRGVVDAAYLERWWRRTTEVVAKYDPDLCYFDWGWNRDPWKETNLHAKFAAFFYNHAVDAGQGEWGRPGVVLCAKKQDLPAESTVRDLERRRMREIQDHVWQTDTSISKHSWGYATDDAYWSGGELVDMLIDIVSKNGVMLLNFGPRADGSIPDEYRQPLLAMGAWLRACGEAIYATRPYVVFEDAEAAVPVRYTRSKDGTVLYAIALEWPGDTLVLGRLGAGQLDPRMIKAVTLVGSSATVDWASDVAGLHLALPAKPDTYPDFAFPVRIELAKPLSPRS